MNWNDVSYCNDCGGYALEVNDLVLEKLSRKDNPQSVIGVFTQTFHKLENIDKTIRVKLYSLRKIRDPGNLGTIIRTIDAIEPMVLFWSINAATLFRRNCPRDHGIHFSVPIFQTTLDEFKIWSKDWQRRCNRHNPSKLSWLPWDHPKTTFIDDGQWTSRTIGRFTPTGNLLHPLLPMNGRADSLNLFGCNRHLPSTPYSNHGNKIGRRTQNIILIKMKPLHFKKGFARQSQEGLAGLTTKKSRNIQFVFFLFRGRAVNIQTPLCQEPETSAEVHEDLNHRSYHQKKILLWFHITSRILLTVKLTILGNAGKRLNASLYTAITASNAFKQRGDFYVFGQEHQIRAEPEAALVLAVDTGPDVAAHKQNVAEQQVEQELEHFPVDEKISAVEKPETSPCASAT